MQRISCFKDFVLRFKARKGFLFHQSFRDRKHCFSYSVFKIHNLKCYVVFEQVITYHLNGFFETYRFYGEQFGSLELVERYLSNKFIEYSDVYKECL